MHDERRDRARRTLLTCGSQRPLPARARRRPPRTTSERRECVPRAPRWRGRDKARLDEHANERIRQHLLATEQPARGGLRHGRPSVDELAPRVELRSPTVRLAARRCLCDPRSGVPPMSLMSSRPRPAPTELTIPLPPAGGGRSWSCSRCWSQRSPSRRTVPRRALRRRPTKLDVARQAAVATEVMFVQGTSSLRGRACWWTSSPSSTRRLRRPRARAERRPGTRRRPPDRARAGHPAGTVRGRDRPRHPRRHARRPARPCRPPARALRRRARRPGRARRCNSCSPSTSSRTEHAKRSKRR